MSRDYQYGARNMDQRFDEETKSIADEYVSNKGRRAAKRQAKFIKKRERDYEEDYDS
jgi:hypothetical protein